MEILFWLFLGVLLMGVLSSGSTSSGSSRDDHSNAINDRLKETLTTARRDLAQLEADCEFLGMGTKEKTSTTSASTDSTQSARKPATENSTSDRVGSTPIEERVGYASSSTAKPTPVASVCTGNATSSNRSSGYRPGQQAVWDELIDEDEQSGYLIYQERFDECNIDYLYHMTHIDNLPSILRHGLLSHNKAHSDHDPEDISDGNVNDLREREEPIFNRSLHDYVPLYFNPKNPMLYKRKDMSDEIAIIHFNRDLLLKNKALFTDGNAASNATNFYRSLEDLDEVDWHAVRARFWHDIEDGKRKRCAEVLVHKKIGVKHIEKIAVSSKHTLSHIDFATRSKAEFVLDRKLFSWNDTRSRGRSGTEYGSRAWA